MKQELKYTELNNKIEFWATGIVAALVMFALFVLLVAIVVNL
jgi:hypothetical protein